MMQASSMLASLQKTAAVGPYALAVRIRSDYDRISNALESQGYYAGTVTIRVSLPGGSVEGRDPALPDRLSAVPAKKSVSITISASKGPLFHLGHISLVSGPLSGETDKPKSTPDASQASPSSAPPQNGAKQSGAASGKAGDTASPKPTPTAPPPAPIVLNTEQNTSLVWSRGSLPSPPMCWPRRAGC